MHQVNRSGGARGRRLSAALLALLVLGAGSWGCSKAAGGDISRLVIETDLEPPFPFDSIQVTVTASSTPEGSLCAPVSESFTIDGAGDFPVVVDYVFGSRYQSWVAYRVVAMSGGTQVLKKEIITAFFDGVRNKVTIPLEAACFPSACPAAQQCMAGACVDLPSPGPFDTPELVDYDTPCDEDVPEVTP
jgi:hypothetical protein